jgi:hypothetical protein
MVLFSCRKSENKEISLGLEYYPLEVGRYSIFDVDSTVYDEFTHKPKEYKYLLKEKLSDYYFDDYGNKNFRLERSIKKFSTTIPYESMPWIINDVFMINGSNRNIEILENNFRFTKLVFPIQTYAQWDGNAKNSRAKQLYSYSYIDRKETINNLEFENTLLVLQKSLRTAISIENYTDKYAKGVGLIYKECIRLKFPPTATNVPISSINNKEGTVFHQFINKYGTE